MLRVLTLKGFSVSSRKTVNNHHEQINHSLMRDFQDKYASLMANLREVNVVLPIKLDEVTVQ